MTPTTTARPPASSSATSAARPASRSPTPSTHASPPELNVVQLDTKNHPGKKSANDPRVGMVGGSYGGQIQFAAAGVDPRIDTIIPIITWSDLSYSLSPNNTSQTSGVRPRHPAPPSSIWALGFSGLGVVNGLQNAQVDPSRLIPCPNFATFVCPALVTAGVPARSTPAPPQPCATPRSSKLLQEDQDPDADHPGPERHPVQPQRGCRQLPSPQEAGHADQDDLVQRRTLRRRAPGEINIGNPNPATEHLAKSDRQLVRPLPQGLQASAPVRSSPTSVTGSPTPASRRPAYGTSSSLPGRHGHEVLPLRQQAAGRPRRTGITPDTQSFLTPPPALPSIDPIRRAGAATFPAFPQSSRTCPAPSPPGRRRR